MSKTIDDLIFGPVPSRRLGKSLGINHIPPKICSYSCVYCQLGKAGKLAIERQDFYAPGDIFAAVQRKVKTARENKNVINYLAFVPDGEPTLDMNLGITIDLLKSLDIRIAVITNASLLTLESVRSDLAKADWVSLKVDSVDPQCWRKINHPHRQLDLQTMQSAMLSFVRQYKGQLVTETMLIDGVNDHPDSLHSTADFIAQLSPQRAYLSIPTRPPADKRVKPASTDRINQAFQIFSEKVDVELLTGYEGNAFAATGDTASDILSITSVHPMRRDAVKELLQSNNNDWGVVDGLIEQNKLVETSYQGSTFYLRKF